MPLPDRVRELLQCGHEVAAVQALEEAIASQPDRFDWHHELARLQRLRRASGRLDQDLEEWKLVDSDGRKRCLGQKILHPKTARWYRIYELIAPQDEDDSGTIVARLGDTSMATRERFHRFRPQIFGLRFERLEAVSQLESFRQPGCC